MTMDDDEMGPLTQQSLEDEENNSLSQQANFRPLETYMPPPMHGSRLSRGASAAGPAGSPSIARADGGGRQARGEDSEHGRGKVFSDNVHGTFRCDPRPLHLPPLAGRA